MKTIINFLILFFCININIIFTTCYPDRNWPENTHNEWVNNWVDNYKFTGISQQCRWFFTTDFTSNVTWGNTIKITNPPAHILQPDSFFGYKSAGPTFNYERVECQFNVEAPVNHGLVVSIQQMYFDKECSDFVQITNCDGSLNETICDKFGRSIPRSYPGSKYLGELNLNEYRKGSWGVSDTGGRIRVKISVTKKNFENLRYLFIAFTAIERGSYSFPRRYYCDGIKNWKTAGDENHCSSNFMDKLFNTILGIILFVSFIYVFFHINRLVRKSRKDNVVLVRQSTTTAANLVDNNNDGEPPTLRALFSGESQQVPSACEVSRC